VPILFNLSEPQRFQLAQRMVQRDVPAGEVVFRQGDQGAMAVLTRVRRAQPTGLLSQRLSGPPANARRNGGNAYRCCTCC
jgi:hypothetical protein